MTILNHLKIVLKDSIIEDGFLSFNSDKITEISSSPYIGDTQCLDCKRLIAMPGFIDIHTHGTNNIDFMEADVDGFNTVATSLYSEGVTTFLATTITAKKSDLIKVCKNVKKAKTTVPSLGGIHLEGPYISKEYKGAQDEKYIRPFDIDELNELIIESGNNIKDITIAVEKEGSKDFIFYTISKGITVSAGHSNATFNDIEKAISYGLTNITHVHNGMSGYHHRNPGIVTAAMYFDSLYTELIADKVHVCSEVIKTFYKIVGSDRLILITDSLKVKNSDTTNFKFGELDCIKKEDAAYLTSGPLCGSILSMDKAIRNMKEICNCSLIDLMKISSYNAAKSLKFTDRGELIKGKIADIVLLNDSLHVVSTYKEGKKVY